MWGDNESNEGVEIDLRMVRNFEKCYLEVFSVFGVFWLLFKVGERGVLVFCI